MVELTREEFDKLMTEFRNDLVLNKSSDSGAIQFEMAKQRAIRVDGLKTAFKAIAYGEVATWVLNNLRGPKAKPNNLSQYTRVYKLSEPFRNADEIVVTKETGGATADFAAWDTDDWNLLEHKDANDFENFINQIGYEVTNGSV